MESRRRIMAAAITGAFIAAAIAMGSSGGAGAQTAPVASLTPATVSVTVTAGGSTDVAKTAQTPVLPAALDVYLLADSTGSMGAYLEAAHTSSEELFAQVTAQAPGAEFGVGQYQDFTSEGPCDLTFQNQTPITSDATAVGEAINAWTPGGGCDTPEGQLYALDRLADPSNPAGFRVGASKAIVIFGDAPAHDPVCAALTGLDHDITEASVTAKLRAAGINLIVVSIDGGMDESPTGDATDYQPTCPTPGGSAGQGTRMAEATGGTYTTIDAAEQLIPAVLAAVGDVSVSVSLESDCPEPLHVSFGPATRTIISGGVTEFTENFAAAADAPTMDITCNTYLLINGEPVPGVIEVNEVRIEGQVPVYTG
jgi:von Willebrand factor type A domain